MKRIGAGLVAIVSALVSLFTCALVPAAPPAAPPPPETYDVQISYRINAFRNERLLQYYEMLRFLKKAGFQRDPEEVVPDTEPEDVTSTRMSGTIPSRRARGLLTERHIHSIQLIPHGAKLPDDKATRVRVEIELFNNLVPEEQYQLHRQTFEVLAGLQFFQAAGYDHRGYTRLVGSMPLARVDTLLTDLRQQPAGKKLPGPFRNVWAVRTSVVNPAMPPPAPRPRLPKVPKGQEKLSPDLRDVLNDAAAAAKPQRLEVILAGVPGVEDRSFISMLLACRAGTERGRPTRTARHGRRQTQSGDGPGRAAGSARRAPPASAPASGTGSRRSDEHWKPLLDASGAARLQALGRTGRGTRLAVVDSDFRGWEKLVGKGLPPIRGSWI